MNLQFYRIETEPTRNIADPPGLTAAPRYRFVSNVNNCVGPWQPTTDAAIKDGENHKSILLLFQPSKPLKSK